MEFRLFKIEIKSLRSSLVSIFMKYFNPRYADNNKSNVVVKKFIILTTADPIQDLLLTPSESMKSGLPILDKISKTVPHFTSNSLYRFKEIPTYSRVTSLNRLKTLTMNKNIKNIKNDFLLNIN